MVTRPQKLQEGSARLYPGVAIQGHKRARSSLHLRLQLWGRLLSRGSAKSISRLLLQHLPALCLALVALGLLGYMLGFHSLLSRPDTLVIYVLSLTDPEYLGNLEFFVKYGMQARDRCEYYVVVQLDQNKSSADLPQLPKLPPNARYVHHTNECYDWGTWGWLLNSGLVTPEQYRYFILMNSSVRGPFFPPALAGTWHWTEPLLSQLGPDVKLVGPAISCEGSPYQGEPKGPWRRNPHVQSYVLATDRVGLEVLRSAPKVMACHNERWDAIWFSELGSSAAILQAGYNLGCLLIRYQGIDWRDRRSWGCNGAKGPAGNHHFDGIEMEPFEVLFVKYKEVLVGQDSSTQKAAKYQDWLEHAQARASGASGQQQAQHQQPVATHWDPSQPLILPSVLQPAAQSGAGASEQEAEGAEQAQGQREGLPQAHATQSGQVVTDAADSRSRWWGRSHHRQQRQQQQSDTQAAGNSSGAQPSGEPLSKRASLNDNPEQQQLQTAITRDQVARDTRATSTEQQPPSLEADSSPAGSQDEAVHQYLQRLRQQGLGRLQGHMADGVLMYQKRKYMRQYQEQQQQQQESQAGGRAGPQGQRGQADAGGSQAVVQLRSGRDINSNEYVAHPQRYQLPHILDALDRGPECFDFEFYAESSPELIDEALIEAEGLEVLWGHWVMHGQFAARPVRWHCPRDYSAYDGLLKVDVPGAGARVQDSLAGNV